LVWILTFDKWIFVLYNHVQIPLFIYSFIYTGSQEVLKKRNQS
jgi:hypothetical protein